MTTNTNVCLFRYVSDEEDEEGVDDEEDDDFQSEEDGGEDEEEENGVPGKHPFRTCINTPACASVACGLRLTRTQ